MTTVSRMYRDLEGMQFLEVDNQGKKADLLDKAPPENFMKIGFGNLQRFISGCNFDEAFYRQCGMDFSTRWDAFHYERDSQSEQALDALIGPRKSYIFVHDDSSRGFRIDEKYLKGTVLRPHKLHGYTLFDYLYLLEHAQEIHCMDSSFKLMVDSFSCFGNKDLYYHTYVRGRGATSVSTSKLDWKVL